MTQSECEKMRAVSDKSQAIGNFIEDFLREKGIILAKHHEHNVALCGKDDFGEWKCGFNVVQPVSLSYNIEKLLAEYFNIDLAKVEAEKQEILKRLQNDAKTKG